MVFGSRGWEDRSGSVLFRSARQGVSGAGNVFGNRTFDDDTGTRKAPPWFSLSGSSIRTVVGAACLALTLNQPAAWASGAEALPAYVIEQFGHPPPVPEGNLSENLQTAVRLAFVESVQGGVWGRGSVARSGGDRWIRRPAPCLDHQRHDPLHLAARNWKQVLATAAAPLLKIEFQSHRRWAEITDHLMAWDIPAYPGYLDAKRAIFTKFVPALGQDLRRGRHRMAHGFLGRRADRRPAL